MLNISRIPLIVIFVIMTATTAAFGTPQIIANDDFFVLSGDLLVVQTGPILANDVAIETNFFAFADIGSASQPQHGTLVGSGTIGQGVPLSYQANSGYTGYDSFQYRICDQFEAHCGTATVNLFIVRPRKSGACGFCDSVNHPSVAVGKPVNVTNGNMYLQQGDYAIKGFGSPLELTRTYNSFDQVTGVFGRGWTTRYDSYLTVYDSHMLAVTMGDGKDIYFVRETTSGPFRSASPGIFGEVVQNGGGSYTLTFKNGNVIEFDSAGKVSGFNDRNSNTTTITYSSGKIASATDAFSRTLTFTTDSAGKVTHVADAFGDVADYTYGSNDRLESVTFPDGSEYNFTYILQGGTDLRLTEVTDALGHTLEKHAYYSSGAAITSEGDDGQDKYTFSNPDSQSGNASVLDVLGHITTFNTINVAGQWLPNQINRQCGCSGASNDQLQGFIYDARGNVTQHTDGNGHVSSYTYDTDGNMLTKTDAAGTITYTYNSFGQVLTKTDEMSGVTTLTYDTHGNPETITDPLNNTSTFTYNSHGQPLTFENARGKTTAFTWTGGNLTQITDALSHNTDLTYDSRSRLDTITDALSRVTDLDYDDNNRLEKVTLPDTNYIQNTFDAGGRRTAFRDARGKTTSFAYDDNNRLTSVTDPLSHATSYGYNDMSNLISVTDANSNETTYDYDSFNQLKKVTYPAPAPSATPLHEDMTYDDAGNLTTRTDTAGRETSYDYDDVDRLVKITDALSNETNFTYNDRSQLTKVTDALSQEYDFTYDALGRQLTQTRNGTTMTFTYDEVGNRASRTDHNGQETTYTYNDLDRLTDIAYTGSANFATYGYNALSQLTSAENQNGTVTFAYDNRNRISSTTDVHGHDVGYTYDANGNRTAISLDSTPHTSYAYDNASRLITLTDEGENNDFTFAYDAGNRLTGKTLPNGVVTSYTYDHMNRLTELKHTDPTPALLYDDQFTYNNAGQISQIAGLSQTRDFTYDDLDRLTDVSVSSSSVESYGYDAVGNRTNNSEVYDPFNRLITAGSSSLLYDDNGSRTSSSVFAFPPQPRTYGWDEENRLATLHIQHSSINQIDLEYQYDALGRRTKIYRQMSGIGDTENTEITYDGVDAIMDHDPVNATTTTYQNAPGIDNKLKLNNGFSDWYFQQDHLGSTVALTDGSGGIVDTQTYDSFGNGSNTGFPTVYQFTGREHDSVSGLDHFRARTYDPQLGRFISEDPIGFAGGNVNLYGYVGNNPLNFTDPMGLQSQSGIQFLPPGTYNAQWYDQIKEDFNSMRGNCGCKNAFEGFGVNLDDVNQKGLVIGSGNTLLDNSYSNEVFGLTQEERREAIGHLGSKAFTLNDLTNDSRPHIFLTEYASQTSWGTLWDRESLRRTFAHELMHAGGVQGQPRGFNTGVSWIDGPSGATMAAAGYDDLTYLNGWWDKPYNNLLNSCGSN